MDRIKITGGNPMNGEMVISGAKNAALPLMITSLLTDKSLTLGNMPRLADVNTLNRILGNHGVNFSVHGKKKSSDSLFGETVTYDAKDIVDTTAPYEMVSRMRASFWVLAPLLARMGEAKVSLPGGCAIGTRPVDLHLSALKALGAQIDLENGYVIAKAPQGGLTGGLIDFPMVSVGATHQALMAATLAKGQTVIKGAACEPEVTDVAECLVKMGAKIEGIGTPNLTIEGVECLGGAQHNVVADRIETGTFIMAVAMASGNVFLKGARADTLDNAIETIRQTGAEIIVEEGGIRVIKSSSDIQAVDVVTMPYPGFPTDLQAQFMALMVKAKGVSRIQETIFENRFMHVQELARLGAKIQLEGDTAIVTGVDSLHGAQVMATDLRASVSLAIAALVAEGETEINRIYHLDRGFENLEEKFRGVGVQIERVSE